MNNFKVVERLAKQEELLEADEVLLTAGASYLTSINSINERQKQGINGSSYKNIYQTLTNNLAEIS